MVYANDIQPAMLRLIQTKVDAPHLQNVIVVQGDETDVNLPQDSIDVALLVDVYHELSHPQEMPGVFTGH
jgi:ubiquinone/menaquinone biosynthesis C-methylase UbiE